MYYFQLLLLGYYMLSSVKIKVSIYENKKLFIKTSLIQKCLMDNKKENN